MIKKIKQYMISFWHRLKVLISLALIIWLFQNYGSKGLGIFLVVITLVIIIRIITNWEHYMVMVRSVEMKIWGRPLDKKYGKPPKVKIKW